MSCAAVFVALALCDYASHAERLSRIVDVDVFLGTKATATDKVVIYATQVAFGAFKARMSPAPVPLSLVPGPEGTGWWNMVVSRRASESQNVTPLKAQVIVGTLRMGYGHARIAHAVASHFSRAAAQEQRLPGKVVVLDMLDMDCAESRLVAAAEAQYSKVSKMASEANGLIEKAWGRVTMSGDARLARSQWRTAEVLVSALEAWPDKATPFVATHPLLGCIAVHAGFTRVINCCIDNNAHEFVVVPGAALNLCQGPAQCLALRALRFNGPRLRTVGHWVPREVLDSAEDDNRRRLRRAGENPKGSVRVLISFGGAGAQTRYIVHLLGLLGPSVRAGKVEVCVNCGDHVEAFRDVAEAVQRHHPLMQVVAFVKDRDGLDALCGAWRDDGKRDQSDVVGRIHVCSFLEGGAEARFLAVHATDVLIRFADVLMSKPSELSFMPLPKIMLRRVGDHEMRNAERAAELGDGTPECRSPEDAARWLEVLLAERSRCDLDGWWPAMCERIIMLSKSGVYEGASMVRDNVRIMNK